MSGVVGDVSCFFQQDGSWGVFGFEGEVMVVVNGDDYRSWQVWFLVLGFGVECFVEFYDVYVVLIQGRVDWW